MNPVPDFGPARWADPDGTPGPREGERWHGGLRHPRLRTSREWSAGVLAGLAEVARTGEWPEELTVFDIARAVRSTLGVTEHLALRAGEVDPDPAPATRDRALHEFNRGWRAANLPHGPTGPHDVGTAPVPAREAFFPGYDLLEDGSPVPDRVRAVRDSRLWWRLAPGGDWTDGTVVGPWPRISALVGATYAAD